MALHETRDPETWQLSGRTELSRAPVSHGCAAQPLLAASHEEALRNVRKLLRAGLWAPGSGAVTELRLTLRYEPLGHRDKPCGEEK